MRNDGRLSRHRVTILCPAGSVACAALDKRADLARLLDLRLATIWAELFEIPKEQWDPEVIGWFLRTAYSQGYADAMSKVDRADLRDELRRLADAPPEAEAA